MLGDPVNLVDPNGENPVVAVGIVGGIIVGGYIATHPNNLGSELSNWWNEPHWWDFPENASEDTPYCEAKKSGKEKASDAPSWAKGERPAPKQKCQDFAKQLLNAKYGAGNWQKGPGTEYNKIIKWCQRGLK